VTPEAAAWFAERTSRAEDWPLPRLLQLKTAGRHRVSVVIPARDEAATIGEVVTALRAALIAGSPLVDELIVIDSDSTDDTARLAAAAGAQVHAARAIRPDLGWQPGKGEAIWKSLFVTTGDLLVFVDADLTLFGPHFVTGLLGPLLAESSVHLVKGFYDRILDIGDQPSTEGGRVTELVARPLLNMWWPDLAAVVQPLAGEWAARRSLMESLAIPAGYGVELGSLLDTYTTAGLRALAQVDLGARAHRHQAVHDLAVMAAELMAVADGRRHPGTGSPPAATLSQYLRSGDGGAWRSRPVPLAQRPPAASVAPPVAAGAGR
jgi:glucosyl-3-phosphoglycerate synthase